MVRRGKDEGEGKDLGLAASRCLTEADPPSRPCGVMEFGKLRWVAVRACAIGRERVVAGS